MARDGHLSANSIAEYADYRAKGHSHRDGTPRIVRAGPSRVKGRAGSLALFDGRRTSRDVSATTCAAYADSSMVGLCLIHPMNHCQSSPGR